MRARRRRTRWLVVLVSVTAGVWLSGSAPQAVDDGERGESRLDPDLRAVVLEQADQLPRLRSLLVSIDGELVEEHYYHGASARRTANLKSASKTIVGILTGIAIDLGHLTGVDQTIAEFFPNHLDGAADPAKQTITIGHLLSMQSGLETTSNRNYGSWVQSGNWVRHVLTRPMVARPGGQRIYSTGNTHLLSAILTKATGMSTLEFARAHLGRPLGLTLPAWLQDPQGIYFGGNEMQMTPRDMLKVGELYLRSGALGGQRVVSEAWVHTSLVPRTRSRFSGRQYGYGWWMHTMAGRRVYYAWGYGGQFIFVVPDVDMVVAVTSSPNPGEGRRPHLRAVYDIVEGRLIPAALRVRTAE